MILRDKTINNNSGQTFIEFLFLLLVILTLSLTLVRAFNGTIGKQWSAIVQAIAKPNNNNAFEY